MSPVIGILTCGKENNRQFVSQPYITAIENSGGTPVLIPVQQGKEHFKDYCSMCQGFLFCGGDDVTPMLLDEDPRPGIGSTDMETDVFQLSFMKHALTLNKPLLCICRGMQMLNAALGGTIYQDLSLRDGDTLEHMQHSTYRSDASHKVVFKKDSILYNICGEFSFVNSYHHQCIGMPGKHITITGTTSDGIAEAVESTAHLFAIGVQWHPECMYDTSQEMQQLFCNFIKCTLTR